MAISAGTPIRKFWSVGTLAMPINGGEASISAGIAATARHIAIQQGFAAFESLAGDESEFLPEGVALQ